MKYLSILHLSFRLCRKMTETLIQRRIQELEKEQKILEEMKTQIVKSFDEKIRPVFLEKKTLLYRDPKDLLEIVEKYSKAESSRIRTEIGHMGVDRDLADILSTKLFGKPCEDFESFQYESYGYGTDYNTLELQREFHFKKIVFNGIVHLTPEERKILQKYEMRVVCCGH